MAFQPLTTLLPQLELNMTKSSAYWRGVPNMTRIFAYPPDTTHSQQLPDSATESVLHQYVHAPTYFRVNQVPSLLGLLFVKFPSLTSPIPIQPPLGKSDHVLLQ